MLSIKQLTLLPINEKLRLRDMMFRKDINQTELNDINCKYDFTINSIDELDNYLPCKYAPKKNITDDDVKFLHELYNLNLSYCYNITDESIKYLGGLHTLDLLNCKNITDAGIISLVKRNNESVEERDSGNNAPTVEDESEARGRNEVSRRNESVKMLGGLHTLNISNCKNITDESVKLLGGLNTLDLSNCNNITDESVKMLGNVHTLYLSYCKNITDESVKLLGGLNTLDLSNCNNITDESVKMLGNVHTLYLSYCRNITDESVKILGNVHTLSLAFCINIT